MLRVDDKMLKLQIVSKSTLTPQWDTAGQERFRTITHTYYKKAHVVFIVADQGNYVRLP